MAYQFPYQGYHQQYQGYQAHQVGIQQDRVFSQIIDTRNMTAPYKLNLNNGLNPGSQATLTGNSKPGAERFHINLVAGSDIAFHFNPRFSQQVVVRNTKRNGHWETEERDGYLPIQPGQQYIVTIACENAGYKVSVNGLPFTLFKHRMNPSLVNKLETNDTTSVDQITYQTILAGIGLAISSGFRVELQYGLSACSEFIITGITHAYHERFSIDFESLLPGQSVNKVLTFSPLFQEGVVERSSFIDNRWGLKEKDGGIPIKVGVMFRLLFRCEPDGFKIYVDGNLFTWFKHRYPAIPVTHVCFTGNLIISEMNYHANMISSTFKESEKQLYGDPNLKAEVKRFYPKAVNSLTKWISQLGRDWECNEKNSRSIGLKECEKQWYGNPSLKVHEESFYPKVDHSLMKGALHLGQDWEYNDKVLFNFPIIQVFDTANRSSPYKLPLTNGFEPGSQITIIGSAPYDSDRFHVNLVKTNKDIAFHFNPRFYEAVVVRNTNRMNEWETEERKGGFPFMYDEQFRINIHSEVNSYKVLVDNDFFTTFKHRIGGADTCLEIADEVYITNIIYQSIMKSQGPNISLEKGFLVGSTVEIFGKIDSSRDRFFIDLPSYGYQVDIPLHVQLRWRESLALLNSFSNGIWGHEQIQNGVFLHPETSVRIVIKNESDGFQVFVNKSPLGFYRHRCSIREMKNLTIRGGFQINMIEYCTKI